MWVFSSRWKPSTASWVFTGLLFNPSKCSPLSVFSGIIRQTNNRWNKLYNALEWHCLSNIFLYDPLKRSYLTSDPAMTSSNFRFPFKVEVSFISSPKAIIIDHKFKTVMLKDQVQNAMEHRLWKDLSATNCFKNKMMNEWLYFIYLRLKIFLDLKYCFFWNIDWPCEFLQDCFINFCQSVV